MNTPLIPFDQCYDYSDRKPAMPEPADPRLILTKQHGGWIVAIPQPDGGYRTQPGGWYVYPAQVQDSRPTPAVPSEVV